MEPQTLAAARASLEVRAAVPADYQKLANLILVESHVHRHLDWRAPLDWLGQAPFWVIDQGEKIGAALACPPDPESIAWIRLFATAGHITPSDAWRTLWEPAKRQLAEAGGATAAAIAIQGWLDPILMEAGFELTGDIVLLERDDEAVPGYHIPPGVQFRRMSSDDLPEVVEVDSATFEPMWRNSLEALQKAHSQAAYASVAEDASGMIGYQLSTGGEFGMHLARLAVRPETQRRGIGAALVADLLAHAPAGMAARVTVNTQADNAASLALYYRLGFRRTGERYPVYRLEVG